MSNAGPKVVYSAANVQQAYLLKGLLEERGIAARVVNDAIQGAGGELPLGWPSAARVVVGDSDAAQARQIATEFDRQAAHGPTSTITDDDEPIEDQWADWPCCPTCGERRSARCPMCGEDGTQFPLADVLELPADEKIYLICKSCDDHFVPEWYRLCPRCGHDYGDGIEVGGAKRDREVSAPQWIVLAILLGGAAVFAAYFAWLLRR